MAGPNFTIFNHIPPTFDGGPMLFLLFFCLKCLVLFLMSQLSAPWELPALRNNKIANTYFAWAVAICCRNLLSLHRRRHEGRRLILVAGLFGSGCVFQRGILRTKPGSRCTAMRKGCVYRVGPCSVLEEKWRTAPRYIYIYIDLTATSLEYFFSIYVSIQCLSCPKRTLFIGCWIHIIDPEWLEKASGKASWLPEAAGRRPKSRGKREQIWCPGRRVGQRNAGDGDHR